jgi:hypothetical protein
MTTDVRGVKFKVGQRVARAAKYFRVDGLHVQVCEVTRVEDEKVYLDYSPKALNFPDRVAILSVK